MPEKPSPNFELYIVAVKTIAQSGYMGEVCPILILKRYKPWQIRKKTHKNIHPEKNIKLSF